MCPSAGSSRRSQRGVVIEGTDAGLQAHALDDVTGGEPTGLAIGVQLIEVGDAQGQVGVGKELNGFGLGGAQDELGDALGSVLIGAIMLGGVDALSQQGCKLLRRRDSLVVILRCANYDTRGMKIVVKRMALAEEFRREEDALIPTHLTQGSCVTHWNGGFDHDPSRGVNRAHRVDGRLHARGIKEVLFRVVVGRRGHHDVVSAGVGLGRVHRGRQAQLPLPGLRLGQKPLDLRVANGRLEITQLLDLLGDDVQRVHIVVLRQEHGQREAHVPGSCDCNLHLQHSFLSDVGGLGASAVGFFDL